MLIFIILGSVICLFAVVSGVLSITGGIFCLKRKRWGLALAGAITSTVLFFPIGIIAVVFISREYSEFSGQPDPNSPAEISQVAN
jgi:NADH:ubiquinone oxidoreductase subunit 6 (subunit J)